MRPNAIAIIFGASRWERYAALDSETYAIPYRAAANLARDYLTSDNGMAIPSRNILDLFDSELSYLEQDKEMRNFIRLNCSENAIKCTDILVYFIGHGTTNGDGRFVFVVRSTEQERLDQTAYRAKDLADVFWREAPTQRRWLFLDCCASAKAFVELQPSRDVLAGLRADEQEYFPSRGTALFAACSADAVTHADLKSGITTFSGALLDALQIGDPERAPLLTLAEVAELTRAAINIRMGPTGVRPELLDPDQRKGQLSAVPFFPNSASKVNVGTSPAESKDHRAGFQLLSGRETQVPNESVGVRDGLQYLRARFPRFTGWVTSSLARRVAAFVLLSMILALGVSFWSAGLHRVRVVLPQAVPPSQTKDNAIALQPNPNNPVDDELPTSTPDGPCDGTLRFIVTNDRLGCAGGDLVPYLDAGRAKNPRGVKIQAIVIHQTETLSTSGDIPSLLVLAQGRNDLPGPLSHVLIGRDGSVFQTGLFSQRVNHVGIASAWNGVPVSNADSIGVTLEGSGSSFPTIELKSAQAVVRALMAAYYVKAVVGHKEVALPPGRKIDPQLDMKTFRNAVGLKG